MFLPGEVRSKKMRWVLYLLYRANFTDFIWESNIRAAKRHGWQLTADRLPDCPAADLRVA
jgi:hypothetical protein